MNNSWKTSSWVGKTGEETVSLFLKKQNHRILDRNFRKTYGELDIISEKNGTIHFVEVKTVLSDSDKERMPEDSVHRNKRLRLARAIRSYLTEKKIPENKEYVVDVCAVFLDLKSKKARIRFTENIILLEK